MFKSPRRRDLNFTNRKLETLRSNSNETDIMLAAVKQLDSIAERAQKLSNKEDSFDQFGKYIASVLRDLPLKKACLLQQNMTNMIMNEIIQNDNENCMNNKDLLVQIRIQVILDLLPCLKNCYQKVHSQTPKMAVI